MPVGCTGVCSGVGDADELAGEEGGAWVGHAGDEVDDADVGHVQVVGFARGVVAHEDECLFVAAGEALAAFGLVAGGDEGVQYPLVEGV